MDNLTHWTQLFFDSLKAFGEKCMSVLPNILGALFILLLGWLFAKVVSSGISRLLKIMKFDTLATTIKADEMLLKANIEMSPSQVVGKFVYYILLLLVFITASETLGWSAVSKEISKLISFLPTLFSAILLFIVGTFIASFVRDFIKGATASLGISTGKIISNVVFYLMFIVITLTALDQGGIDTTIITSNMLIILGSILAAGAISYGFASKEVLANILASFFSKKTFVMGQTIQVDDVKGRIIDIQNISVTVQTATEKVVIPTQQLINRKVKIFN